MRSVPLWLAAASLLALGCSSAPPPRACATTSDCADTDACTTNERCDPATRVCTSLPLDGDRDGFAPLICGGTDCDDSAEGTRCGDVDGGSPSVDPVEFCANYQQRVCLRDRVAGRIDMAMEEACYRQISDNCMGFSFAAGCQPTRFAADACLDALVDPPRVADDETLLPECMGLCS